MTVPAHFEQLLLVYTAYHYFGIFISDPRVKWARQIGHRRRTVCAR